MAGNSGEPGRTVVSRIAAILDTFAVAQEQTLSEVARSAGLPVATAYRLLTELADRQLRERDGRLFRIGLSMRRISASGDGGTALVEDRAAPLLDDLATATGCRVRLGVLTWPDVAFMEKQPGSGPVAGFTAGARLPTATSALGGDHRPVHLPMAGLR